MLVALLALAFLAPSVKYDRYKLFELVLCADSVVSGEIEEVHPKTFGITVQQKIAGEGLPLKLQVERFENWTCASRWTDYRPGQRVLLFLHRQGPDLYTILGGGGEGEMPILDSNVVVRGYRLHGYGSAAHPVGDAQVEGALVPLEELTSTVQGFREVMQWEPDKQEQVARVCPRRSMEEATGFAQRSRTALDLFEEARSSLAWQGPVEQEGAVIPIEPVRKISARDHGLSGPTRIGPGREPDRFGFELWSGFGRSVALIGDVDGDGVGDLAVGAPSDSYLGHFHGALWILFLNAEGGIRSRTEISERVGAFPAEMNEFAALGEAIAPLGDLNGDGVPDLAVGAPGWDANGKKSGGAWVLFLARDGTVSKATELGGLDALRTAGVGVDYGLGASLANIGDLNKDGVPELAVGQDPAFNSKYGREVLILSLERTGAIREARKIPAQTDDYSWFGDALAGIGDLDGNGVPDIAVANTYDSDGGEVRGAVWIVFLGNDGSIAGRQKISDWEGGFDAPFRDGERFGQTLAGPGDVDGDGHVDLLVGSSSGIWTLLLNKDGTVKEHHLMRNSTMIGHVLFAVSVASSVSSSVGEAHPVVVGGVVGSDGDRDAVIWFFSTGRDGALHPW